MNIERKDTGPADQDRTAAAWFDNSRNIAQLDLFSEFMATVDNGSADALCAWAPDVIDWEEIHKLATEHRTSFAHATYRRTQTMAEVMLESLDYKDGPTIAEAMQLILDVARSSDELTRSQAMRLLERMADAYAKHSS